MPFQLPFGSDTTAIIDVRHGGEKVARAMIDLAQTTGSGGRVGMAVYQGIDDDKVLTYGQWAGEDAARQWLSANAQALAVHDGVGSSAGRWSARLFRLASSANRGVIDLADAHATIAHTGLFAMTKPNAIDPFLQLADEAARIAIDQTPALLTANFHASLDTERAVNLGFWIDEEGFRTLAANPPFQNRYWDGLAENEPGFYRRVWVTA